MAINEKKVFEARIPNCAVVEKEIYKEGYGLVAYVMNYHGSMLTFFRTDFLDLDRVAWDENEVLNSGTFHEEIPEETITSIKANSGFFVSKYFLSNEQKDSVVANGGISMRNISCPEADMLCKKLETEEMASCLIYGAIYDTIGKWLIKMGAMSEEEWKWSPDSKDEQGLIMHRDCGGWTISDLIDGIFDREWTLEKYYDCSIVREGTPFNDGEAQYPARKRYTYSGQSKHPDAAARAFMFFK